MWFKDGLLLPGRNRFNRLQKATKNLLMRDNMLWIALILWVAEELPQAFTLHVIVPNSSLMTRK
jgi:hypothetical protein